MRTPNVEILAAPSVRRSLTTPGDIRTEIDFQNDINSLIARMENVPVPWKAMARLMSYDVAPRSVAQRRRNSVTTAAPLRVLDGGGTGGAEPEVTVGLEEAPRATAPVRIRRGA